MKVPKKHRGHGLHVFCTRRGCTKVVTSDDSMCNRHNILASNCPHNKVFQSRVWNPISKQTNCIKTHETKDFDKALEEHRDYVVELKQGNYNVVTEVKKEQPTILTSCMAMYIDYLKDIDVPEHEKKHVDNRHVKAQVLYLKRFLECLRDQGIVPGKISVGAITSKHVGFFHETLKGFANKTYNHHMDGLRFFFNYMKTIHNIDNPFDKVKKKRIETKVDIIYEEEFEDLLRVITPENGVDFKDRGGRRNPMKINHYRPYLKELFYGALLIGERADGIVQLKWSHVEDNYIRIPNYKVNRLKNSDSYINNTPITTDLAKLLISLGMEVGSDKYIFAPEVENREMLKIDMSRAFTHYWKQTGHPKKTFKHLRKSYVTRLVMKLGDKAVGIKQNDVGVIREHYLKQQEITKELRGESMFNIDKCLLS